MRIKLFSIITLAAIMSPFATQAASEKDKKAPEITVTVNKFSETVPREIYSQWTAHESNIFFDQNYKVEFENTKKCSVSQLFCDAFLSNSERVHFHLQSKTIFKENVVRKYLEDLARKSDSDPVDAKLSIVDGKVSTFTAEQQGSKLNIEKSIPLIADIFKNSETVPENKSVALAFDTTDPKVTAEEVNNLGISKVIGQGVSNFKGSPVNRIKNIKVAANRFNGVLIKPGEEFSFVKTLGEVDQEHGYFPELVIKKGVTEPEFGGGVCQVSTTAFRAAIYSGLKITARRNHAYPVSYYNPQGMDSTVYVPQPDLRFVNNTPGHILIQTTIVGTQLTFDFYGTDDGRTVKVDGPTITERQPDGALKATFTQHVTDKNGEEFIKDVFNSSYASPYKYPHPGGPVLTVKPSNWSEEEWKNYKQTIKDMAKAAEKAQ